VFLPTLKPSYPSLILFFRPHPVMHCKEKGIDLRVDPRAPIEITLLSHRDRMRQLRGDTAGATTTDVAVFHLPGQGELA
jgi:hypothetical protein